MKVEMRSGISRLIIVFAAAASGLMLSGCGQKGNLYLPNQKQKVPASKPQNPAPAQTSPNSPPATSSSGAQ
jgi:predicted small lipoprotein YifL